jgi:hypothetical protein
MASAAPTRAAVARLDTSFRAGTGDARADDKRDCIRSVPVAQLLKPAVEQPQQQQQQRPRFLEWLPLFALALEWTDLETMISAQLTCRHVLLMLAQRAAFRGRFYAMQPFERVLARGANGLPAWTCDLTAGETGLPGVPEEAAAALQLLSWTPPPPLPAASNALQSGEASRRVRDDDDNAPPPPPPPTAAASPPAPRPGLTWKAVARRYERQTEGVACRLRTAEYFRGVWRLPERVFWRLPHFGVIESPPFFMTPRARRRRLWSMRSGPLPPQAQQEFRLLLQRSTRADGNTLGMFLQPIGPIEGGTHDVVFTVAVLDRSLSVEHEYRALRRLLNTAQLSAQHPNTGFVLPQARATRFWATGAGADALRGDATATRDAAEASPEDLVIEVEVFSLGPGISAPEDVLACAEEFGQVLTLTGDAAPTAPLRTAMWRMLRDLSHTDPYTSGVMSKRKRLLRAVLPALLRDLAEPDTELLFQCTGVLWNMSDVDVPPVARADLERIVDLVFARLRTFLDLVRPGAASSAAGEIALRYQRVRTHCHIAPALLGCIWNFPYNLSGTLALFGRTRDALHQLLTLLAGEVAKADVFVAAADARGVDVRAFAGLIRESIVDEPGEAPVPALLFACCHHAARVRFYLMGVTAVRRVVERCLPPADDANGDASDDAVAASLECMLLRGVAALRAFTHCMSALGVSLFSRDYTNFFLPLLGGRASAACVAFASFCFDSGYFLPQREPDVAAGDEDEGF